MPDSLQPYQLQHARLPCPSLSPGVCSNSCPWSQWCHPTISSSITPSFSCHQHFPASEPFPMSQLFTWGGQSIGASASASLLPVNDQGWFLLGLIDLISLLSKGLSSVFPRTTIWKHQYPSLYGPTLHIYVVHWRREWQTTSVFLPWEPHEQYEKAKW